MPREIDTAPDAEQAYRASSKAAGVFYKATNAALRASDAARLAEREGDPEAIETARKAYVLAANLAIEAAEAAQLSANHAAHAASAFSMKGISIE
jgi:hypothetical protein